MKDDMNPAAFRLLQSCRVTTHKRRVVKISPQLAHYYAKERKERIVTGAGRGGANRKPFIAEGRRFDSIKSAAATLHRSPHTIRDWLETGLAKYL